MDLTLHETEPPAGNESLEALTDYVGRPLPARYRELLQASNGLASGEYVVLYAAEDVPERNDTYGARECAPGYLAIGDDGGGRAIMLKLGADDPAVTLVDHGSMSPEDMEFAAKKLSSWIEAGFPLPEEEEDTGALHVGDLVDVYLESLPTTGIKGLMLVKKLLILDIGIMRLKELSEELPALLQSGVRYGTSSMRCAKVNAEDDCLRIRPRGASPNTPGIK